MKVIVVLGIAFSGSIAISAQAAPVLMSPEWATAACTAWSADPKLTDELGDWIKNDKKRGYKVLHLFRTDCPDSAHVELRIENRDGKAVCAYGGKIEHQDLDFSVDYIMSAETARWQEMGRGEYGPMRAMMFGRLKFQGPKMEAMGNMGPFGAFLRFPGTVENDSTTCPTAP